MFYEKEGDDLLDRRETAYLKLEGDAFKPEQELAEKYRTFVTGNYSPLITVERG